MKKLLFTLSFFVASTALAQSTQTTRTELKYFLGTASTTVKGNAAESARTFSVELDRIPITSTGQSFPMLNLFFELSARTSTTAISLTCYASNDGGTTLFVTQAISTTAGLGTSSDAVLSKAISGTKNWVWRLNTTAFPGTMKCIVAFTSGAVGDELTVSGNLSTK